MGYGKKKTECQDTFTIMEDFYSGMTYFAVYDGHGTYGRAASDLANKGIRSYLEENKVSLDKIKDDDDMSAFLKKMCNTTQSKFKESTGDYQLSGTCAICILIKENKVYIANLGDSRAVIGNFSTDQISALEVSIDHKPTRDGEKDRVLKSGGKIERSMVDEKEVGPFRVWKADEDVPGIAITRSLGDFIAHKIGVIADPEVTTKEIEPEDKFIIIGSDGVWDVMSSAEAVGFVLSLSSEEREQAAEKLVNECRERWDLLNEIKRKQAQIMYDNADSNKKMGNDKSRDIEKNIVCDDITVVIHYLPGFSA